MLTLYSSLEDPGVFDSSNSSRLAIPFPPPRGGAISVRLINLPSHPIPPGQLLHNVFSTITNLWLREDNSPIEDPLDSYASEFSYIHTRISSSSNLGSVAFTPLKVLCAYDIILGRLIPNGWWQSYVYEVRDRRRHIGTIQSYHEDRLPRDFMGSPNGTSLLSSDATGQRNLGVINVRPIFSSTRLAPERVLILYWYALRSCWMQPATALVRLSTSADHTYRTRAAEQHTEIAITILHSGTVANAFTWGDLAHGILRALVIPARLNRWNSMEAQFMLNGVMVATMNYYEVRPTTIAAI